MTTTARRALPAIPTIDGTRSTIARAGAIQLATGLPVMAIGGFSGSDPTPTLEQLQAYVASGQLRFVLIGDGAGGGGPNAGSSDIAAWVTAHGTLVESVGNGSLFDLSTVVARG